MFFSLKRKKVLKKAMHACTPHSEYLRGLALEGWNIGTTQNIRTRRDYRAHFVQSLYFTDKTYKAQRNKVIYSRPCSYLMEEIRLETRFLSPSLPFFIHVIFVKNHVLFITLVIENRKNTVTIRQKQKRYVKSRDSRSRSTDTQQQNLQQ